MVLHDRICNLLEPCVSPEAPLCPLQEATLKNGIWYCDEPVCKSQMFENVPWIKKQKIIAAMKLTADDGYFTVRMLNSLKTIYKDIKGASPDSENAEADWLENRKKKRYITTRKTSNPAANKLVTSGRLF